MAGINVMLPFFGFHALKRVPAEVFFIFGLTAEWSPGETQKPVPFPRSITLKVSFSPVATKAAKTIITKNVVYLHDAASHLMAAIGGNTHPSTKDVKKILDSMGVDEADNDLLTRSSVS
ncbi:60S acidic ribosomal protein P2 [Camelus dromedarius]|uniref:60S acidic ribosomal protein P2 n=1 Tax=Camelus dromedarius TaxID=9838 RepID=A0A5N4EEG2_CAMDR|nr:60S acidic ribosomal protein P2 [Camelus dromedarius]